MPLSGELRGMNDHRPARNAIVAILGTPDRTEGSLDDPREREEDGVLFNEKWIYTHLHRDPAGAAMRTIYWMRYDFRGTAVRNSDAEPWRADTALVEVAAKRDGPSPAARFVTQSAARAEHRVSPGFRIYRRIRSRRRNPDKEILIRIR